MAEKDDPIYGLTKPVVSPWPTTQSPESDANTNDDHVEYSFRRSVELHADIARVNAEIREVLVRDALLAINREAAEHAARMMEAASTNPPMQRPPGNFFAGVFAAVFPKKAFEQTFAQHIADYRAEIYELLAAGNKATARWRHVQLNCALVWNAVWFIGTGLVKKAFSLWKIGG